MYGSKEKWNAINNHNKITSAEMDIFKKNQDKMRTLPTEGQDHTYG
jgi:hypothetical protein